MYFIHEQYYLIEKTTPLFDFFVQCETVKCHLATRKETEKCIRRDVNRTLNIPGISQTLWCYGIEKLLSTPVIQFYRYQNVAFKKFNKNFLIEILHTKAIWNFTSLSVVSQFFLFQINAPNKLNTYIYHHLPLTCFGVCYTIFRETQHCKKHIFLTKNAMVSLKFA
jgi:hypothetical protein